jgi:hypothetical protein
MQNYLIRLKLGIFDRLSGLFRFEKGSPAKIHILAPNARAAPDCSRDNLGSSRELSASLAKPSFSQYVGVYLI